MSKLPVHADGERVYIIYHETAANPEAVDDAGIYESFTEESDRKAKQYAYRQWRDHAYVLYGCTFKDNLAIQDDAPLAKHWC